MRFMLITIFNAINNSVLIIKSIQLLKLWIHLISIIFSLLYNCFKFITFILREELPVHPPAIEVHPPAIGVHSFRDRCTPPYTAYTPLGTDLAALEIGLASIYIGLVDERTNCAKKTRRYSSFSLTKRALFFDSLLRRRRTKKTRRYSAFSLTKRALFPDSLLRRRCGDTVLFH